MSATNDIASHVQNISEIVSVLVDLRSPIPTSMLLSKILCNLPPSYISIIVAWSNIPENL